MTPAVHYIAAEACVESSTAPGTNQATTEWFLAAAQVHATLALVGAVHLASRKGTRGDTALFDAMQS